MLQVREVTKSYDGRAVVNRVSFEVHPGEIFALLGPNGAGKTTLIRMITDILKPDSGSIELDGRPVTGDEKRRIAYLPEERGLYRRERVVDVLRYYGQLKGLNAAVARQDAMRLLERVELAEVASKQVQTLSKGMQQKLQLCTTLIGDPRVLILDEPFSGLDPVNVQLLEEMLDERRSAGVTVLLSTHQMNKVEELCDRALMINQGNPVLYGPVRELRRQHSAHALRVRAEGRLEGVPGVRSVEPVDGDHVLMLEPDATPKSVLKAMLDRGVEIESFEVASLPLEEIFIKVVREGIGLASAEPARVPVASAANGGAR